MRRQNASLIVNKPTAKTQPLCGGVQKKIFVFTQTKAPKLEKHPVRLEGIGLTMPE